METVNFNEPMNQARVNTNECVGCCNALDKKRWTKRTQATRVQWELRTQQIGYVIYYSNRSVDMTKVFRRIHHLYPFIQLSIVIFILITVLYSCKAKTIRLQLHLLSYPDQQTSRPIHYPLSHHFTPAAGGLPMNNRKEPLCHAGTTMSPTYCFLSILKS